MKKKFLLLSCCFSLTGFALAQQNSFAKFYGNQIENPKERVSTPSDYQLFKINLGELEQQLVNAPKYQNNPYGGVDIRIPNESGTFDIYKVVEFSNFNIELQEKYPGIRAYKGYNTNNPSEKIHFSVSPYFGFNAVIRNLDGLEYIDSYSEDNKVVMFYNRNDVEHTHNFECKHDGSDLGELGVEINPDLAPKTIDDGVLRHYRLAIAATTEYTTYIAQQAGVSGGTDAEKIAAVMDALNVSLTRLNEVYVNDLSVMMELVSNNDEIVFITTDNYSVPNTGTMLSQNQTTLDNIIGNSNYDIGHVFYRGSGGGVAYLRSVCSNNIKAGGVTGTTVPVGDPFDIDYVAHEMGHQYGANHTQNNSCQRNGPTAVEPGSASTIMGYAGICPPNVQNNSDAYFHAVSINEMNNWVTGNGNCGVNEETGNNAPTADAGLDRTIPIETPFLLEGIATDTDADLLTYNFEQTDTQSAQMPPRPENTGGPMFRSVWAVDVPEKYFPRLSTIIEGYDPSIITPTNYRAWEKLPAVSRQMNFAFFVRDNNPVGVQTARDNVRLIVDASAGPFVVTSQNSEGIVWNLGESQTITWDVANTNVEPVSAANVKILVSTDGGLTFPHVLVESTPNNGTYTFSVPTGLGITENARIMVKALENVFLNVNSEEFTINSTMGTDDLTASNDLVIYPNPSPGIFKIDLNSSSIKATYAIFNMEGKLIVQNKFGNNVGGKFSESVNVSHLPTGNYIVKVTDGKSTFSEKLIIKK